MTLVCVNCGVVQRDMYSPLCRQCGSMTNPQYELNTARLRKSDNPFVRFFDLLPVRDMSLLPRDAQYTPTVHARNLGRRLSLPHLFLKNETVLPTGTTKYRMAAVGLPYLYESGVRHFCTSSTGNSSTAYAQLIENIPGLRMTLLTASDFHHRVNFSDRAQVEQYVLQGASFVEAFEVAGDHARDHGLTSERGFFNPGRREGLKLAFLEATEQVPRSIDCYVQAVSSAMGVYGTYGGARELLALDRIRRVPRLLCIQQVSCSPMAAAWAEGAERISERHIVHKPSGIAAAILRGNPQRVYPHVRRIVKETGGTIASVSEDEIRRARGWLREDEGIDACFSASAAIAGLIRLAGSGSVGADESILVNLTGSDRAPAPLSPATFLEKVDGAWKKTNERPAFVAQMV